MSPKRIWEYVIDWVCDTNRFISNSSRYSNGDKPLEVIRGDKSGISDYLEVGPYYWVEFISNSFMVQVDMVIWIVGIQQVIQLML